MDPRSAYVALNMIENVGPVRVRQLLEALGDPVAILGASRSKLESISGIGAETSEAIAGWRSGIDLDAELKRIDEFGCQVVTWDDPEYPQLLREIYDPPVVLYVKGELKASDKNSIALVGSRQTTSYGMETARKFGYQLAYAGVTVVSGGARGIDTGAHLGAIAAKGRTIAVLGTGINLVFPPENAELFERIALNGAVMSQFPFNRPADKQSFPIRNRIVAGMTLGTVVVEANLTSGALITANFATDYGRQVFAVPGRIDSPRSRGCHDLIKKGAKLCEGLDDILPEFEYLFPKAVESPATSRRVATGPEFESFAPAPSPGLTDIEARLLAALDPSEEKSIDQIVHATGIAAGPATSGLFSLELKRLAKQLPGKLFVRPPAKRPETPA
jgi:DNA processing protein